MEKVYLCTQIVRERTKQREPTCLHDWPSRAGRRQSQRAAPRQRASSLHSVCTVLVTRISKGMQIFLLLIHRPNYHLERRKSDIISRWSVRTSADFALVHDGCGRPVGDKVWGLRFLYAFELVLSPQDLETKVITIKRSKI